jgi:4-hydroxy-tetrahydrodipicolinate reductase
MTDVVVGGATGRLGSIVCRLISESEDLKLAGATVSAEGGNVGREMYGVRAVGPDRLSETLRGADVYVDLTTPDAAAKTAAGVPETGANLVLGTTSVPTETLKLIASNTERYGTSSLVTANFSPGVNVFWKACEMLAGRLPGYDIEVIEAHHGDKEDAPSGTASEAVRRLRAASGIDRTVYGRGGDTGPRGREIGVHSIRAGDIVGDHTVLFAKNSEVIELTHRAGSREALALGCVESIRWISGKKDGKVHSMDEVLGIC